MLESEKLYVIDLGDDCAPEPPAEPQREIPRRPARRPAPARPRAQAPRPRPIQAAAPPSHFALRLALTYLLGPLSVLLWPAGRRGSAWPALGLGTGLGAAVLVWKWDRVLALGEVPFHAALLVGLTALLLMGAFSAWARALYLAYAARPQGPRDIPAWMRSAWGVTGLGLLAPGLGLYLTGAPRRAVAVLWLMWPGILGAVVLSRAGETLAWLQGARAVAGGLESFERALMIAAGLTALAMTAWLVQALVGLHRHSVRVGGGRPRHGDRFAVALLAAVAGFVVLVQPVKMAGLAGDAGAVLRTRGLQVIPLHLAELAHRLDPGETSYALELADLLTERGDTEAANRVQADLEQDFRAYYGMFGPARSVEPAAPVLPAPAVAVATAVVPAPEPRTADRPRMPRWTFSQPLDSGAKPDIR